MYANLLLHRTHGLLTLTFRIPNLAVRWRADGTGPIATSITVMAAHPVYIGKSVEVRSGSSPLCGLENRGPKGYAGSSPVPSAIQDKGRRKSSRWPFFFAKLCW
jgi:hypothetical protein